MKLAIAQVNARVGDVDYNLALIARAIVEAERQGATTVVFPELVVTGYPPRDLLFDSEFVSRALEANDRVTSRATAIFGGVTREGGRLYNSAIVTRGGRRVATVSKRLLPSYDVFHEARWFTPGPPSHAVEIDGRRVGLMICEDMWDETYDVRPGADLAAEGAEMLICLSASPYRVGAFEQRLRHARRAPLPLVYVNAVGAQDELIFDGASFAVDGQLTHRLRSFEEDVTVLREPVVHQAPDALFEALSLGLRDFVRKNGLRHVFLGLSGGIDSALVACIAAHALGPSAVTAVAMPSRFTDARSTSSARELAEGLGIGFEVIPIDAAHEAMATLLGDVAQGTVDENLQARVRAMVLMALVNARGGMLLNTSNKSELALGYGTLYGDMAGALSVIGDLTKSQVYALACGRGIPAFIMERPPSAELRFDQVDPFDYARIDAQVGGHVPPDASLRARLARSEHKRWQAPIILKVSEHAFGTGRMIPVTHGFRWREAHEDTARRPAPAAAVGAATLR